jgi:hypothetical protein
MEIGWEVLDFMHLAQNPDQWGGGSYEHSNENLASIKGRICLD